MEEIVAERGWEGQRKLIRVHRCDDGTFPFFRWFRGGKFKEKLGALPGFDPCIFFKMKKLRKHLLPELSDYRRCKQRHKKSELFLF